MATLSPMMQQYMRLKEQNPDTLLFFRVGDFYEMFFEDALTASRELELTLTGKDCGMEERAPMCGVPYHAVDTYVARLVEKGYRVAIGGQMQDPALAKGLVDRDVIRIVTAGTLTDSAVIGEKRNNFLCSLCVNGKRCGIAACDVSTGEFLVQQVENMPQAIKAALDALSPTTDTLERDTMVFPQFNRERCIGCGRCQISCADGGHQAIRLDENRHPKLNGKKCVGCHLCSLVCPTGAIGVTKRIKKKTE